MQFSTDESEEMIGYSMKISELKCSLSRKILTRARRSLDDSTPDALREQLQGEQVSYISVVTPWWTPAALLKVTEERSGGTVLIDSGYPFLLIVSGRTIIEEIAEVEGSRHEDLKELLDPETLYLVEAWDQS